MMAEHAPSRAAQQLRSEVSVATAPSKTVTALRGAAEDASANAALIANLTALDDKLVQALKRGDIRLVDPAWLLAQPDDYRMQRRQALEELERGGASPSPLLPPEEAVRLLRLGDRSVGAVSYGETPWEHAVPLSLSLAARSSGSHFLSLCACLAQAGTRPATPTPPASGWPSCGRRCGSSLTSRLSSGSAC